MSLYVIFNIPQKNSVLFLPWSHLLGWLGNFGWWLWRNCGLWFPSYQCYCKLSPCLYTRAFNNLLRLCSFLVFLAQTWMYCLLMYSLSWSFSSYHIIWKKTYCIRSYGYYFSHMDINMSLTLYEKKKHNVSDLMDTIFLMWTLIWVRQFTSFWHHFPSNPWSELFDASQHFFYILVDEVQNHYQPWATGTCLSYDISPPDMQPWTFLRNSTH